MRSSLAVLALLLLLPAAASAQVAPRVVNGDDAGAPIPWQIALVSSEDGGATYDFPSCGGTIISATRVVTAAHCYDAEDAADAFSVVAGLDRWEDFGDASVQVVGVSAVEIHPDYVPADQEEGEDTDEAAADDTGGRAMSGPDVAVLQLAEQLDLSDPQVARALSLDADAGNDVGVTAIISGWGAVSEGGPQPDVLQRATADILPDATCEEYYGDDYDASHNICAGDNDDKAGTQDTCQGDSGGPLAQSAPSDDDVTTLIGVVSFGDGCAREGVPGVYARVAAPVVRNFIDPAQNPAVTAKPVNRAAPAVEGTTTVGQTVTCATGTWDGSPSFSYQWQRVPRNAQGQGVASSASNIPGATGPRHVLGSGDAGMNIACVVTGTNGGGSAAARSVSRGAVAQPPAPPVAPAPMNVVPGPLVAPRDLTRPVGSLARPRCTRTSCRLTLTVTDAGGLSGVQAAAFVQRLGCPRGRRGRACRRVRTFALSDAAPGRFAATLRRLRRNTRYRITVAVVDASGNAGDATVRTVRTRRR